MLRVKPSAIDVKMPIQKSSMPLSKNWQQAGLMNSRQNVNFKGSSSIGSSLWKSLITICEKTNNNKALSEAAIGCAFASFLRPVTIIALPGAKKEDKQYAAGKAFISGFLSLAFSALFFIPLNKYILNPIVENKLLKGKMFPFAANSVQQKAFKFLVDYGVAKFAVGALDAFILFKLLHPVVHALFGNKKAEAPNKGGAK